MPSLFQSFCSCMSRLCDEDVERKCDVMQVESFDQRRGNTMNDLLIKNLLTIRGRRSIIRDIPLEIEPTKFEVETM